MNDLTVEVWNYLTKKKGTANKHQIAQDLSIPLEDAEQAISTLESAGHLQKSPFGTDLLLKHEYTAPEEEESKDDSHEIQDTDSHEIQDTDDNTPPPPESESKDDAPKQTKKLRDRKAAKSLAKNLISKYRLENYSKLNQCQVCGSPDSIISIPDPTRPYNVNSLCRSCLHSEDVERPRTIQLQRIARHTKEYSQTKATARAKIYRFTKSFKEQLPLPICQRCGATANETTILKKMFDYFYPYEVVYLCQACEAEIRTSSDIPWPDPTDLWSLLGITIPPELRYEADEVMAQARIRLGKNLKCFLCETSYTESDLTLEKTDSLFYLTCDSCQPTASQDIQAGFSAITPIKL